MKGFFHSVLLLLVAFQLIDGNDGSDVQNIQTDWINLDGKCLEAMRNQVQMEINASVIYMAMGAHFFRDVVNRPGFGEMFMKASREEREHARKLTDYMSMRGKLTDDVTNLIKLPKVKQHNWENGVAAISTALELETNITKTIKAMIKTCEYEQQYHLVDYLTGVFLEEQLHAQRDLAGKLVTLKKLMKTHSELGEFLFDLDLLDADPSRSGHF